MGRKIGLNGGRRGFQPPHKANIINAGFSPGGMLSANFTRNPEFFRSLFAPEVCLFGKMVRGMAVSKKEEQADQRHFVLSDEQWRAFTEAQDRPARHLPQLEKLLREPSILEQD